MEGLAPGYVEHFREVLDEEEIEFAIGAFDGMEDALKIDCFEVFKKAVTRLNMVNEEFAGIYVSRKFSMFSSYIHQEWLKVHTKSDDIEFRAMLAEYGEVVNAVGKESEERKQYVQRQEEKIMERIKEDYETSEER
tara:strand:- start:2508 stop:2915 length:408 start_codon:yes stop_codon:yes gene_type:complete